MRTASPPSNNAVNKAGKLLRKNRELGPSPGFTVVEIFGARETVQAWRSQYQRAMTGTNMGLRSFVNTAGCLAHFLAQRLKRLPQIVAKLSRHPNMALSTMQDVGGCRAILSDQAEVERVRRPIHKRWEVVGEDNYVTKPQRTGYRAIHVVDCERGSRRQTEPE